MASIVTYGNGLRRIEFAFAPNERRKIVRLGRVSQRVAEGWKAKIEAILADRLQARPHDPEIASWLAKLDEKMLGRLRDAGLADGIGVSQTTLGGFMDRLFAAMTGKPQTRVFYGHTRRNLEDYFGAHQLLRNIRPENVDAWRAWLVENEKLAPATVARRVIAARTMWRRAVRWKLTGENPFVGVKGGHQSNESRKFYVSREIIDRVIEQTPDLEWKVIIALSRYGGLRTPSEVLPLKWTDIDFDRGTIRVTCPKLEHIEHCAQRTIPLFPELRTHLLRLFTEETPPGAEYVIIRNRLECGNLGPQFRRILLRAKVTPWPRLFHNLRASRESELMREYDLATVCKWIGNSPVIAAKHYAVSVDLDADFRRATGLNALEKAQQKAQQSALASDDLDMTTRSAENDKPRQNPQEVTCSQSLVSADRTRNWAILDLNQ